MSSLPPPPQQGAVPPAPMSPGMAVSVESASRIDQAIRMRTETDHKFINWWLYVLVISWITFGIAGIYYYYRKMSRVDAFSRRKQAYYAALVQYTEERAAAAGAGHIRPITDQMRAELELASGSALKPIGAAVHFLLTIVTLGVWAIAVQYMVNRAWDDRQRFEAVFDDRLSHAWLQLGLLRSPITFRVDQGKERNFLVWVLLSIVTFGIWSIVWDYRIWTDPDRLYPEFHVVEDAVLQIVRTA